MLKKIYCPHCGKWLLTIETGTQGIIYIWCRQCRKEKKIVIEPLSHP